MMMGIFYLLYKDYNFRHMNNRLNKILIKICKIRMMMRVSGKMMMLEVIKKNNNKGRRELKCK